MDLNTGKQKNKQKIDLKILYYISNKLTYYTYVNKQALEAEDERNRKMDEVLKTEERKRSYNSLNVNSAEPTEEEMEAYRMKRSREDDPMAQFMKKKK